MISGALQCDFSAVKAAREKPLAWVGEHQPVVVNGAGTLRGLKGKFGGCLPYMQPAPVLKQDKQAERTRSGAASFSLEAPTTPRTGFRHAMNEILRLRCNEMWLVTLRREAWAQKKSRWGTW